MKNMGQQRTGQQTREKKTVQPQTQEQRGKRACAFTARGSIGKAMKGLVGGAAAGSAECRKHWTTSLIPRTSGQGTHPSSAERAQAAWGGGRYKKARSAMSEQGRSKSGTASLPHFKVAPMGERQKNIWMPSLLSKVHVTKEDFSESSTSSQSSGAAKIFEEVW